MPGSESSVAELRHLKFDGAYNVRDLGGYPTRDGGSTQWRKVLRADSPHRLTGEELDSLAENGLGLVIDLRRPQELEDAPNPFARRSDVDYLHVSLLRELSPTALAEAAARHDSDLLFDLYCNMLSSRQKEIGAVLQAVAESDAPTVMFHCTAGKDRTGVIAMLLLGLVGVEDEHILADYTMTGPLIEPLVDRFTQHAAERGVDPVLFARLLGAREETMVATLDHFRTNYGTVDDFLDTIGLDSASKARLRARLTGQAA